MSTGPHTSHALALVANARMPSQRAQSLQLAQVAGAFQGAGTPTTLLYARRRGTPVLEDAELMSRYPTRGQVPVTRAVPCMDWIESFPRSLQYLPARLQEWSFARSALGILRRELKDARVLTREIEVAHGLRGRGGVFLEVHRVPGGQLRQRWLTEAARDIDGLIAISEGVQEDLLTLGVDRAKLIVAHDGVDLERFANLPERTEARATLGLAEVGDLVVYTGGLLEWKGVDELLVAARRLPTVRFVIAGGMDQDVARLRSRAEGLSNVRVDGFQPPDRVALYLAAGDLGVVPNRSRPAISARYTSPLKVFEAMAAGLPLVCSDLPSLRAILSAEDVEFVAPDDGLALAAGVERLLGDAGRRQAMGRMFLERAPEHSWERRARKLLDWMGQRTRS